MAKRKTEFDMNGNPIASKESLDVGYKYLIDGKVTVITSEKGKETRRPVDKADVGKWINVRRNAKGVRDGTRETGERS